MLRGLTLPQQPGLGPLLVGQLSPSGIGSARYGLGLSLQLYCSTRIRLATPPPPAPTHGVRSTSSLPVRLDRRAGGAAATDDDLIIPINLWLRPTRTRPTPVDTFRAFKFW